MQQQLTFNFTSIQDQQIKDLEAQIARLQRANLALSQQNTALRRFISENVRQEGFTPEASIARVDVQS